MITGLQLAILSGGLVGLGAVLVVARFLPAEPDLADALERVSTSRPRTPASESAKSSKERLGLWGLRVLPPGLWVRTPSRELALLRIPVAQFYGEKLMFAGLGLVIPPVLVTLFNAFGLSIPFQLPAVASLLLAAVMFFIPNYNALDDAKKARVEFARALGAYIDLVALERNNGIGHRQAMEAAAEVGDSWVFTRLSAGQGCRLGTRCTPWQRSSDCPSSTTSPTSCASRARKEPACTRPCAPDPPPCAQRCSTTNSRKPTPSGSACRCPARCSA